MQVTSALTSILKIRNMQVLKVLDRGVIANAYGVEIFPINDNYVR